MKAKIQTKDSNGVVTEREAEVSASWGTYAAVGGVLVGAVVAGNMAANALGLGLDDDIDTGEDF